MNILNILGKSSGPDNERSRRREPDYEASRRREPDYQPSRRQKFSFDVDEKSPSPIAVIYQSEYDYISRCILDYPNIETGGDLFGYWTNEGIPVVLYAIGPGRNANHQMDFFVQDIGYFEKIASTLNGRYQLSHMGEWHSHHQLGLAHPSGHDARTIFNGLRNVPLRRMLLCIANYRNGRTSINPFNFHENDMSHFKDAYWQIIPMDSPFRQIIDAELRGLLIHPRTAHPCHGESRIVSRDIPRTHSQEEGPLKTDHWLRQPGKVNLLRKMISFVQRLWPESSVNTQWDETGNVQLTIGEEKFAVRLPLGFPEAAPRMIVRNQEIVDNTPWTYHGREEYDEDADNDDILSAFTTWLLTEKERIEYNN